MQKEGCAPRLALYQPDIPQNTGSAIRLCACLGVGLDVIEPCGFRWDIKKIKQSALDYYDEELLTRHSSWERFFEYSQDQGRRCVLMTTNYDQLYTDFSFGPGDILIAGRESAGVPDHIHQSCAARIGIKMSTGRRSLNVINASAIILGEALRQSANKDKRL